MQTQLQSPNPIAGTLDLSPNPRWSAEGLHSGGSAECRGGLCIPESTEIQVPPPLSQVSVAQCHRAATHKQLTAPTMSECPNALKKKHRQLGDHKTGLTSNLGVTTWRCSLRNVTEGMTSGVQGQLGGFLKEGRLTSDSGVKKMNREWGWVPCLISQKAGAE